MKRLLLALPCLFATGCAAQPESNVHEFFQIFQLQGSVPDARPAAPGDADDMSDSLEGEQLANALDSAREGDSLL